MDSPTSHVEMGDTCSDSDRSPVESAAEETRSDLLAVRHIHKDFPTRSGVLEVLDDINITMQRGDFVAIVGASGAGKSTLLRIIAGLEQASSGKIQIHGQDPVALRRRHELGIVFQEPALLPWASVEQNIRFPLRISRKPVSNGTIQELVDLVGLNGFERAKPRQLSGGMRQRVAIARALVVEPTLLLMDEPFGALDEVTRMRLNEELLRIWSERRSTALLVTHSVAEAVYLADRVVVMGSNPGRVIGEWNVPFGRPRERDVSRSERFHRLCDELRSMLLAESARAGSG